MHGLTVIGQGYIYSGSNSLIQASFSAGKVSSYPPFLTGEKTLAIVLVPTSGMFLSFKLQDFSVRYLSQAPQAAPQPGIDASSILALYLAFLFLTPTTIVILVSRLFSNETKQSS
jgi:hypothetical protein